MPYPAGHRNEVRKKIVESARRLFNRHGFNGVSLKQIMAGAGLTHGGFYSYFVSKSDLYVEVLGCFFTDPEWKSCWEGVEVDLSSGDVGPQVVRAYLSRQHFEDVENSCPMTALPTDVARGSVSTKRAFETVFRAMVSVLERSTAGHGGAWRAAERAGTSYSGVVRRRDDSGAGDGRPSSCGRIARRLHGNRAGAGRVGQREEIEKWRLQAGSTGTGGGVLDAAVTRSRGC
jgi:TetR/AcrR family transcriptional regulator, transcriptional repressor for nem operon